MTQDTSMLGGRRRLMRRAGGAVAGAVLAGVVPGSVVGHAAEPKGSPETAPQPPPWMLEQGDSIEVPYGSPAPFEKTVVRRPRDPLPFPTSGSFVTPLQDLEGIITPSGLHFIRNHAGTPQIDPDLHRLLVHGMVERPLSFSMDDLVRFPSVSRLHFLECSGNTAMYRTASIKPTLTAQHTHGLLSCSEWTGVRLADVLAEAGLKPGARWLLAEGADAAAMTRSIPIEKALDDAILAYAQNGERLRPEQGYPLRLLLPGYEGNSNVKWLRRLKIGDQPFETREETSKYTDLMLDGTARQFNFVMEVKSVILRPSTGRGPKHPGFYEINGLAWSGRGHITRVEISADGGASWRDAALQEPVLSKCLTRFRLPWSWDGGPARLLSRATDNTGAVQPTRDALMAERGANFYYHYNAICAWQMAPSGEVTLAV
jgi:sulfane dehydrogenase subunit SoxC